MRFSQKTQGYLVQSGSLLKPEEFFVIRLLSALTCTGLLYGIGLPWYGLLPTLLIGFIIPAIYMKTKAQKRIKLLSYQLVEALGTMSNSMRAGFSFVQTMQLIGKEMPDPLGPEFDRAVREIGMGVPMEDVFQRLLERLPNKELEVVIQAILAQRKSGGNLAQLMDTMEDTIRGRIRILEELKTLTAQGKLSSWIITALPVVMGIYLYFVSPDYLEPMLTNPLGLFLLGAGVISLFIGWFFIQRIVRIEV
jgi:tight adherence protein B